MVFWNIGIDGGGKADGFATTSAARASGDSPAHALPNDGKFAANSEHPLVLLPYGQVHPGEFQARSMPGPSFVEIKVPHKKYRDLFLFFTSAEGGSLVSLRLDFRDGTSEVSSIDLPDYYREPSPSEKNLFALAPNLAKWNAAGKLAEADHHYIYGWKIASDAHRILQSMTLTKTAPGYLVFWGATGVSAD